MATFPGGIVSPTNPVASDKMNIVSHAAQHTSENNEIVAIETALGVNLANVVASSAISTSGTLAENSDTKIPSQKAVKTYADAMVLSGGGIPLGYLDTDGTLAANSDTHVASQKAVVTYVDTKKMTYPGVGVGLSTGTAWGTSYTVGTAANNLVQMTAADKLPAVDGSLLTSLTATLASIVSYGTSTASGATITQSALKVYFGYQTGIAGNSSVTVSGLTFTSSTSYVVLVGNYTTFNMAVSSQTSGGFALTNTHNDASGGNGNGMWLAVGT